MQCWISNALIFRCAFSFPPEGTEKLSCGDDANLLENKSKKKFEIGLHLLNVTKFNMEKFAVGGNVLSYKCTVQFN